MVNKTILASATLIGTIIGAGVFGIPYVVMQSGFLTGVIHIFTIALLMLLINLYLGEVALRTKSNHHLTGYAEKYLGKKGKILMFITLSFGIFAGITAYLIGIGESLSYIFFNSLDYTIYLGIAFWIIMSILCFQGIKALKEGEFIGVTFILILILGMAFFFFDKIDFNNLTYINSGIKNFFLPFGVVLFALLGYTTIPEIEKIIGKDRSAMKKSIIISIAVCALAYIIFTAIVIGVKGSATPELATLGLGKPFVLLGILTMFTSYLALSIALIDTLCLDIYLKRKTAWFFTIAVPIILFLILQLTNTASFTLVLSIGGVISGSLASILAVMMASKAKYLGDRLPEYSMPTSKILTTIIILILAAGTVSVLINTF
jgi:amino acid permease